MATYAPSRMPLGLRTRALTGSRTRLLVSVLGFAVLLLVSALLRTQHLDVGYWIDEGLSVGIADRPLSEIPGALRLDGSPPLYYGLLNVWMTLVGSVEEEATHALSLVIGLLCVPIAFAIARTLFGPRAGWIAAVLFALNPFLTQYSQETRMYALVMLLGLIATGGFVAAFAYRRRAALPVFALGLVGMLYTHNWSLFFGLAAGATWLGLLALEPRGSRRALLVDGALAFGAVALLYAPWIPTLLFQAAHTGAPWSSRPGLDDLTTAPARLLGPVAQVALLLAGGAGLATLFTRRRPDADARAAIALISLSVLSILIAWLASQASPAWAVRYMSIAVAPLLLLGAFGLSRAGRLGLAGLAIVALMWSGSDGRAEKSNVRSVASSLAPGLRPGDLVVSTQPEQVSVLEHYLPDGLRWATLWGTVGDVGVTDWRDGVTRLEQTNPAKDLTPLLDSLAVGQRLVLIQPTIYSLRRWNAPWTSLVRVRSEEWSQAVSEDRRFRVSAIYPPSPFPEHPNPVKATVLLKQSAG